MWRPDVAVQPSLSVNQSAGSLAVTKPFGPEVLGVTRCGNKERTDRNMNKLLILRFLPLPTMIRSDAAAANICRLTSDLGSV